MRARIVKIVVWVLAILSIVYMVNHYRKQAIVDVVDQNREQFEAYAQQQHPDLPLAKALEIEGKKRIANDLKNGTAEEQKAAVAGDFLGFYLKNVRTRVDICKDHHVDIKPYADEFVRIHTKEFAEADAFFKTQQLSANAAIDMFYDKSIPTYRAEIEMDYKERAAKNNSSIEAECKLFTAEMAKERHYSKIVPEGYAVLMGK
jgi:hypothetical protein